MTTRAGCANFENFFDELFEFRFLHLIIVFLPLFVLGKQVSRCFSWKIGGRDLNVLGKFFRRRC